MSAQESEFIIGDMHFAAKHWGNPEGMPVLALHGWLDNSASFDFIAPLLPHLNLVCLDLAGQGKSDHRSHFGAYNIWQDVSEVFAVADALKWSTFGLIGHSRGAAIATLAAGAFPERIRQLALIEGICPFLAEPETAPKQLAESVTSLNIHAARPQSVYDTFERAVAARVNGVFKIDVKDAEVLAARGVEEFEGGFTWAHDYKLMAASEVRFNRAQFDAFIAEINIPIHLLLGKEGFKDRDPLQSWLGSHPNIPITTVGGGHHLHMSTGYQATVDWLNTIFKP